ncbi:MAG: aldehyde dehydrogenase [Acidimicrobiia bacterium]|nr:aldehyde dehydrogenase [Acidimicrobiia bacterium]
MIEHDRLYIGGEWVAPSTTSTIEVVSPFTEEVVGRVPEAREADVDRAVAAARVAFDEGPWPRTSPAERADVIAKVSQLLQGRMEELAKLITTEMGSPISFSMTGQTIASTMILDFYTGLAREYAFEEVRQGVFGPALVRQEPVGVAGAIVPWNVPLFVTALKLGPALAAGCTIVLKPAPETPLDAYVLAEVVEEAGLPPGVLNIVPAGREVGEHLVTHPDVDKIAFTGSTVAGRRIASLCGERLRRVTLELGGKSAAVILDDADLETTVPGLMYAGLMNNGQACVAQTRILASRRRYDEVVEAVAAAVGALKVGDPMDPETNVGPLVAERQRERVEGYLALGREEGATVAVGGGRPAGLDRGWFVEPTVFTGVDNSMRIAQEEIFGPVLCVIPYDGVDDAVRIANDSDYGLSGTVWTADVDLGLDIARRVRTGTYTVNGFMMEFCAPFGGFKCSGLGRELGPEGLTAYLEQKTVCVPAGHEVVTRGW